MLISDEDGTGTKLGIEDVVNRINQVNWAPDEPMWQGILMNGDKVITGNSSMKFAARVLAYLLGQKLENLELAKLKEQFTANTDGKSLPDPIFK